MRFLRGYSFLLALFLPVSAQSGELLIRNVSASPVVCHADGYTSSTGWPTTWDITVPSRASFWLAPSYNRPTAIIDWAECGGLKTQGMNLTPQGIDGLILFTGKQHRVLNAALYPDIPSHPNGNFRALLDHVVDAYQAINPDVLLNAVMADEEKIYSFDDLPAVLGPSSYDVVELDTLYLGFLASSNLITPAKIAACENTFYRSVRLPVVGSVDAGIGGRIRASTGDRL
jgi:thiamine pyridinylase